jgi:cyclase
MLKKRLVGVITVKDGWAVQSFGYRRYLPLGRPECLAENLDRWGVDEILVLCIDRSLKGLGPDFPLLKRLGTLGLSTPLTYGGGIHTVEDAAKVIQSGAERLCVDAALHISAQCIREMAAQLGAQAMIAALPLAANDREVLWYDYQSHRCESLVENPIRSLFSDGVISEALVIDWCHEGQVNGFDRNLVNCFPIDGVPLITFGGLSESAQLTSLLDLPRVVAVGVGNFLSYSEHAAQSLKKNLTNMPLRPPLYAQDYL